MALIAATSCASKVWGVVQDLALKHLCYIVNAGDDVRAIGDDFVRTRRLLEDIKSKIEKEERDGRKPTAVAKGWIADVDKFEAKAQKIQQDYDRRGCTLCRSFQGCSFNFCASYRVGKEAAEKLDDVKELLKNGDALLASNLATEEKLPPPVQVIPTSTKSLGFKQYLAASIGFLNEENCKFMLGIWGKGGAGKTTLLTEINNLLARDLLNFHHVIRVVASQGCTTEKIQTEIIKQLRLPVNHTDISSHANAITNYLISKNFLLLLDDVWEYQDLVKVGIPHPDGEVDQSAKKWRKVIIVCRREDVCRQIGAQTMIHVEGLMGDDAWRLFEEKVGKATIKSHPLIQGLAEKVVEECGGLPLALVTIGRAMSNTKNPHGWKHAIRQLQRSQQISGTEDELFSRLKLSYDYLKDDGTRDCFLHCALWPEDYNIRENDLIECWIGHGLINGFSDINEACEIGHIIIENLKEADLLMASKVVDKYGLEIQSVRMHDVMRDMALWIARDFGANPNKWIVSPGQVAFKWTEVHKFSNMDYLFSKTLFDAINTSCPSLTTLMLPDYSRALKYLPFFHNLKYLDMPDCGMESFPLEICKLAALEYLNLSGNYIHAVPVHARNLENLKHLNLFGNWVSSLPKGFISNLTKLQVLDVCSGFRDDVDQESIIDQLHCIEQGRMKALGINASSILQVRELKSIPITRLCLQGMHDVQSLSLSSSPLLGSRNIQRTLRYLLIKDSDIVELVIEGEDLHPLEYLETLLLKGLPELKEIIWKAVTNIHLFPTVTRVVAIGCGQLKHMTWILHLPCLEFLEIKWCRNMMEVISEDELTRGQTWPTSLSCLKRMKLEWNENMACISSSAINFPSLNYLSVEGCRKLKKLPFGLREGDCANLQIINCSRRWWDKLRWEEPNIKDSLLPLLPTFVEPSQRLKYLSDALVQAANLLKE